MNVINKVKDTMMASTNQQDMHTDRVQNVDSMGMGMGMGMSPDKMAAVNDPFDSNPDTTGMGPQPQDMSMTTTTSTARGTSGQVQGDGEMRGRGSSFGSESDIGDSGFLGGTNNQNTNAMSGSIDRGLMSSQIPVDHTAPDDGMGMGRGSDNTQASTMRAGDMSGITQTRDYSANQADY